jgi:hypothetical protein
MARRGSAVGGPSPKMPAPPKAKGPTPAKAKAILSDGEVRGNPLTAPQKGLFGAIAGGSPRQGIGGAPTKARTSPRSPQMAIGQRSTLGARTRNAMMPKVRSRS